MTTPNELLGYDNGIIPLPEESDKEWDATTSEGISNWDEWYSVSSLSDWEVYAEALGISVDEAEERVNAVLNLNNPNYNGNTFGLQSDAWEGTTDTDDIINDSNTDVTIDDGINSNINTGTDDDDTSTSDSNNNGTSVSIPTVETTVEVISDIDDVDIDFGSWNWANSDDEEDQEQTDTTSSASGTGSGGIDTTNISDALSDSRTDLPDYEGNDQYDLNEPDWNRLGRNEKISRTIISYKENNKTKEIPISFDIDSWDEPSPYYNAFYPENKVFYTHHGLLVELDDTIDNRRIHIYHPSNTYIEISEHGNLVFRNSGNRYDIIDESLFKLVKQDYYKTISGTEVTKIEGEKLVEVDNDYVEKLHSDKKSVIDENKYTEVKKDENLTVGKNKFTLADDSIHLKSNSSVAADSGMIYLNSGKSLDAKMDEDYELQGIRKKVQQGNRWWNEL